jgi:porphobilinogen synthase
MNPKARPRRLRRSPVLRDMLKETRLYPSQLIMPYFVTTGREVKKPISSMPGQFQWSADQLLPELEKVERSGIKSILLFGLPKVKDLMGSEAYSKSGVIQKAVGAIKRKFPELIVMTDLCFCEYTSHGHCGVIKKLKNGSWDVDNDATLKLIRKAAVAQAEAGADFVAPSGMMDGAVAAIREELDRRGFKDAGILAYSAKYASVFYGPFREAAESAPQFGNRRTYQMDPPNLKEALREIASDVNEGADMVMVKPALSYLDVIARVKPLIKVPLVAYNVSGEYAMVKAAEKMGWLGQRGNSDVALEILTSIKRAGADLIISYHALDVAGQLKKKWS